jgi:hypothetical protein
MVPYLCLHTLVSLKIKSNEILLTIISGFLVIISMPILAIIIVDKHLNKIQVTIGFVIMLVSLVLFNKISEYIFKI